MGVQAQSALIAAILLVAIGVNLLFRPTRPRHRNHFFWVLASLATYNLFVFLYGVSSSGETWRQAMLISAALIPPFLLHFFEGFLDEVDVNARRAVYVGAAAACLLVLTTLGENPVAAGLVATYVLGASGYCISRLYVRYRETSSADAPRLRYLVVGGAVALALSATDLLPRVGVPFPAVGHLTTTLYMFLWSLIIQRSRLLDLKEVWGRGLVFLIQAAALSLVYVALLVWVGDKLGLFFFNTVLACVVLILIYEPLQEVVETWVTRLMFRETFELEASLVQLGRQLANVIDLDDMVNLVLDRLEASPRVTHASVFLLENDGRGYFMPRAVGPVEVDRVDVVKGRAFLEALRSEKVLVLEQVERERADLVLVDATEAETTTRQERLTAISGWMRQVSADVCFAFPSGDRLLGFLNIRDDQLREGLSNAEVRLITRLATQATVVIENTELYERLKERDRLSVLGEMAAGLAHEIRNPLGAIRGACQLLEGDLEDDAAERGEFLGVIVEEVDRLNTVVSHFLDYARPWRGHLENTDVNRIVRRVATLIRAEERSSPIEVELRLHEALPPALADAGQLEQVCLNLARNGCDAMEEEGGQLTITTTLCVEQTPGRPGQPRQRVEIRIMDTGAGIPEGLRENIFIPFFTTRRGGTGLGLSISQRIVQHHGGSIGVRSWPGRGTTFNVRLPLASDTPGRLTGEFHRNPPGLPSPAQEST